MICGKFGVNMTYVWKTRKVVPENILFVYDSQTKLERNCNNVSKIAL